MTTLLKRKHALAASKLGGVSPFSLVSSVQFGTGGASGGTTSAINTTGATLIIIALATYAGTVVVTDSKGNSGVSLTRWAATDGAFQFIYIINPIVGTGHTFTSSGASVYPAMFVYAFKGPSSPVFQSEIGKVTGASPLQTGSITPSKAGALVISGFGTNNALSPVVTPGFTQTAIPFVGAVCVTGAFGYLIQPTASPINPSWSWTSNPTAAITTVVFLPS